MFYTEFQLFKQYFPCTPKAKYPGSSAFITQINFSGTKFSIYAPPADFSDTFRQDTQPESSYDLSAANIWEIKDLENEENVPSFLEVLCWHWPFYGPFFTGLRSVVKMNVYLVTDVLPAEYSSFHNINVLFNFMKDILKHEFYGYTEDYKIETETLKRQGKYSLPSASLHFKIVNISDGQYHVAHNILAIPLTSTQLLYIRFDTFLEKNYKGEFNEVYIDTQPTDEYIFNIVSGLSIELSQVEEANSAAFSTEQLKSTEIDISAL